MDGNPEKQLAEEIKHCQKTARNLKKEYANLLKKSTATTGNSDHLVKASLANDANKRFKDIDLALKSNQQQLKLVLEQYLSTQLDLPTSEDRPMIQMDTNKMEVIKYTINQQVKLSGDNIGQNKANLNSPAQALFSGTLPDDFFLHLMSVIGIQECLLSNRLVCSFWNELVLERCRNQKSLKLFETFDNLMEYGEDLLKYEKTDDASLILKSIGDDLLFEALEIDHEQLVKSLHQENEEGVIQKEGLTREKKLEASKVLTDLFPKVEDLVLCTEYDTLINIEHLLQFYAQQLTSLTMNSFGPSNERAGSKLRAFNFPKLKSLNTFYFSPEKEQLLSLLPQLESLTLHSTKISLETLLRTGTQLRELNIYCMESVYTSPRTAFSKPQLISNNVRKFTFGYAENVPQALEFISLNLTSLECLQLNFDFDRRNVRHLNSLTSYLRPLHRLHSLTLEAPVSFFLLDNNLLAEIKPQPSVRHLKLQLWDYASLPRESMDLFSRALFTAFPNAEQALIAFVGNMDDLGDGYFEDDLVADGRVDTDTLAAFEDFAGKHPNVVQLFRSKDMSKCTKLPNVVSPLLGHRRQVYEEYLEEEELFGVAICKLVSSLIPRQGEEPPNLKIALRPADRVTAMSNLLQLLESGAFAFTYEKVKTMIEHMVHCAFRYAPSEGALFTVTCKCVLFLFDCRLVDAFESDRKTPSFYAENLDEYSHFRIVLKLLKHSMIRQLDDKEFLLLLYKCMVELLKEPHYIGDNYEDLKEFGILKVLLKLANYYQTQQLNVLDDDQKLLLQIHDLMDDQLQMFENDHLDAVIIKFICSKNRVYRVEMARALLRCCESTDNCLEWLSGEGDSDSSESTSDDSSSSEESEL